MVCFKKERIVTNNHVVSYRYGLMNCIVCLFPGSFLYNKLDNMKNVYFISISLLLIFCFSCSKEKSVESGVKKAPEISEKETTESSQVVIINNVTPPETAQTKKSPPEITYVKILPEVFKAGDTLNIKALASSAEGTAVSILYEWTRNGEPAGNGRQLAVPVKRGDRISVKVTPFDSENYGKPIVLKREILNLPPVISEDRNFTFDGTIYTYQVKASDPDGDALTYSLKSAPEGMNIDPPTGLIKWNVPTAFKGEAPAAISVSDGHGGEAVYNIKVLIGVETMK